MKIETIDVDQQHLLLRLPDEAGQVEIIDQPTSIQKNSVLFLLANNQIVDVLDDHQYDAKKTPARLLILTPNWDIMAAYLAQYYRQKYQISQGEDTVIPSEQVKHVEACAAIFDPLLDWLGYRPIGAAVAEEKKAKSGKPQHKWTKLLTEHPFYVDYQGSKATVYWQKRNQVRIEKGAILSQQMPLNKDGSIGYSARLSEKIRQDNQAAITDYQTTEDVILKSVNEMGMFLYYGGTNGWLVLVDDEGKTLNEWTV
ncbi:hypothetical protein [Enterococcus sp. RIT-PI-f]|uniref:hypothetical protein n=1 Tax=Enterococcus sp. RIT-PI-f TaxID=1690244 RepID=UPI0006B897D8|nr:hypothetical protein [Enterococcus sp. RIT-PI-f]KPG71088.1 hypothetical protein AEQ18_05530 [Enterococcus sp. RIT-PI-f]